MMYATKITLVLAVMPTRVVYMIMIIKITAVMPTRVVYMIMITNITLMLPTRVFQASQVHKTPILMILVEIFQARKVSHLLTIAEMFQAQKVHLLAGVRYIFRIIKTNLYNISHVTKNMLFTLTTAAFSSSISIRCHSCCSIFRNYFPNFF